MSDATLIHQLRASNATLHERLAQLNRQRDAFQVLCVECKAFIDGFVDNSPDCSEVSKKANYLDSALESALAIHR